MYTRSRTLVPPPRPVDLLCEDCPIHLEDGQHPDITRMGGKPLHCHSNRKAVGYGCYDRSKRGQKVAVYRAILEKHEVIVEVTEEVPIHA